MFRPENDRSVTSKKSLFIFGHIGHRLDLRVADNLQIVVFSRSKDDR
jgi:hypothetical protein